MNITKIIKKEVIRFNVSPYNINNGYCGEFADIIHSIIKNTEIIEFPFESKYFGHIFIKYKGKYYDAEAPK